jgi:hypothetical protein
MTLRFMQDLLFINEVPSYAGHEKRRPQLSDRLLRVR